jgi:hypothetical protein
VFETEYDTPVAFSGVQHRHVTPPLARTCRPRLLRNGYAGYPCGATFDGGAVNFAVFSSVAARIEVWLYDAEQRALERSDLLERIGHLHHGYIPGLQPGTLYGLRVHGPYEPEQGPPLQSEQAARRELREGGARRGRLEEANTLTPRSPRRQRARYGRIRWSRPTAALRLCRYIARPPLAHERLTQLPDGRLQYVMKKRWRDGTHALVFDPLSLIGRLISLLKHCRMQRRVRRRRHRDLANHSYFISLTLRSQKNYTWALTRLCDRWTTWTRVKPRDPVALRREVSVE